MKRIILILLILLLLPMSLLAAITIDGTPQTGENNAGTVITISQTIAGSNRLLLCGVTIYHVAGQHVSGITWNTSENFTAVSTTLGNADTGSELWYLLAPSTGTHNVVVTVSSSTQSAAGCISLNGVDQGTPLGTPPTPTSGTSTTPSLTITSATGELVIDALGVTSVSGALTSMGGGQTLQYDLIGTGANSAEAIASSQPGAASVTNSYTINNSWNWAMVGVSVKPSGGGAAVIHNFTSLGVGQ